ncbi:hypothetical protein [Treponema endosymbiont of Eucomonympha sp.]|uniref:hypothetical protein n=1 Tax=Treponema endosymbiont of Eucomonympha sp. TaxID=1580831 RepID=UPI0013968BB0|nr:hypothetical protein [Treponema endosymbiont of Eucomonympha sp.]
MSATVQNTGAKVANMSATVQNTGAKVANMSATVRNISARNRYALRKAHRFLHRRYSCQMFVLCLPVHTT